jgi:hypothetical protein
VIKTEFWVPEALSLGVKRPGCEVDHSPPSSAEVKEWVELCLHSPNTPSWRGAQLKHRYNFICIEQSQWNPVSLYRNPIMSFRISQMALVLIPVTLQRQNNDTV